MIFWINSIQYLGLSFHDHSHPTMCSLIREKPEWKVRDFQCRCGTVAVKPGHWTDIDNTVQEETQDTKSFTEASGIARPLGVVFDS